jgi:hypothetical protein
MEYAEAGATYQRPGDAAPTPIIHNANTWIVDGEADWAVPHKL